MATERQIEANRRNATLSTGPRTEEGKAVSRRNACTHGLAGEGVVMPEAEARTIARRAEEWAGVVRPANGLEAFLVLQLATESVRVERCQGEERVVIAMHADRAADPDGWHEDRCLDAEELGARLARDPARTVRRLRQTAQGCDWLLARWDGLAQALDAGTPWDATRHALALDLLGVPPALRTDAPADPRGPGADNPAAVSAQRELVAAEVAALESLRAGVLEPRDAADRDAAEAGVFPGEGPAVRSLTRLRRYESACRRRFDQALRQLLSGRLVTVDPAEAPAPAATDSRPASSTTASPAAPAPAPSSSSEPPPSPARPVPPPPLAPAASEPAPPLKGNRGWRKRLRRLARGSAA